MGWKNKRFRDISVKWKLLLICILLVSAPVIAAGTLSSKSAEEETFQQIEDQLTEQAIAWRTIVEDSAAALDQQDGMIRQQVMEESKDIKTMMEALYEQYDNNPPADVWNLYLDKIAERTIGDSGYIAFLSCSDGNVLPDGETYGKGYYILSKNRISDGVDILQAQDYEGNYFVQDAVNRGKTLGDDEAFSIDYPWKNEGEKEARMKIGG